MTRILRIDVFDQAKMQIHWKKEVLVKIHANLKRNMQIIQECSVSLLNVEKMKKCKCRSSSA